MYQNIEYPKFRWWFVILASIGLTFSMMTQTMYATLLGEIAKDLNIPLSTAVNLQSVIQLSIALCMFFIAGRMVDRIGIAKVAILGVLLLAIPSLLTPVLPGYGAFLIARIIQGIGGGFAAILISPILAIWMKPLERGKSQGVINAFLTIGSLLGVTVVPRMVAATGNWRITFMICGIMGIVPLLIGIYILSNPKHKVAPIQHIEDSVTKEERKALVNAHLISPFTIIGIISTFCIAWVFQVYYDLCPSYFAVDAPRGLGWGFVTAGSLFMIVIVAGLFGPIIGGTLVDKVFKGSGKPLLIMAFALTAFGYGIMFPVIYNNQILLTIVLLLAGVGLSWLYPSMTFLITSKYPSEIVGTMNGWWTGIGNLGGSVGLWFGGIAIGIAGNYSISSLVFFIICIIGLILANIIKTNTPVNENSTS